MSDGIWAAVSGAVAQQRALDVTANNVANANTTGFRGDRVAFREALSQASGQDDPAPDSLRFVNVSQVQASQEPGALRQTGGTFDLAIEGDGWFSVETPNGERYTRAGQFSVDGEGVLRSGDGAPVLAWQAEPGGETQELRVPLDAAQITIGLNGTLSADGNEVGQLAIRSFEDDALTKEGDTRFVAEGEGTASDASVLQGYLESSNINAVAGMNQLITVSRSFEAFQKIIDTFQQMDQRTARDLTTRS
ncbi:MAG: flagellar basal-body rod protein FlgF [Polyangiales bacterium]|jgi:flagellar basal-body rod protein FlgF